MMKMIRMTISPTIVREDWLTVCPQKILGPRPVSHSPGPRLPSGVEWRRTWGRIFEIFVTIIYVGTLAGN